MIRVFVVDDHPVVREGICTILNAHQGAHVVDVAGSCAEARRKFEPARADVLLLDLALPDGKGIDLIKDILQIDPRARIIMLTVHEAPGTIRRAFEAGALGYVLKDTLGEELVEAVRCAARGEKYVSPQVSRRLAESLGKRSLTAREYTILEHLARGLPNKLIASEMRISEQTVKTHVRNILEKLDARDRLEAVVRATREQLIELSSY